MDSTNDVYYYIDTLMEKLKDNLEDFQLIVDSLDKIEYVKDLLVKHNLMPDYSQFKQNKSDETADMYRLRGNELLKSKKLFSALICYNKCLCFAECNSKHLALCYENRSAIYCEIEEYEHCLENIQLARLHKCPQECYEGLNQREQLCRTMMTQANTSKTKATVNMLRLTHKANRKVPFVVDCLELRSSMEYGRHIITNKTLNVGDVVVIEKPFTKILSTAVRYERCCYCLDQNKLNLIPCENCTSVMFCSEVCKSRANKKFHFLECDYVECWQLLFTKVTQTTFRTFCEALFICDGSAVKLEKFLTDEMEFDSTVFDYDFSKIDVDDVRSRKKLLQAVHNLASNEINRGFIDDFHRSGCCAILFDFCFKYTPLRDTIKLKRHWDLFNRFIYKHSQIAALNFHELYALAANTFEQENVQFGSGSFPFCSLINHSCAPNLIRITFDCSNYVIISRKIPKGGQLFDSYGYHHTLHPLKERQKLLLQQYRFKCRCQGCTKNYPLFQDLAEFDPKFDKFIQSDIETLEQNNLKEAKEKMKKYCKYINKCDDQYPCYEISMLQECLLRCLRIFEKFSTNMNSNLIESS